MSMTRIINFLRNESGQDLVEYVLIIALIALGATVLMKGVSSEINAVFGLISSDLGDSL